MLPNNHSYRNPPNYQLRSTTTPKRIDEEPKNSAETSFDSLAPALNSVADSFATLNKRFEKLQRVNEGLCSFNESFGSFLAGMVVNGAVVEWPEAPTKESIELLKKRTQKNAVAMEIMEPIKITPPSSQPQLQESKANRVALNGNGRSANGNSKKRKAPTVETKPATKRRLHTKSIKKIIDKLPLDYREQTTKNKNMQLLLEVLIDTSTKGLTMKELAEVSALKQYIVTDCINVLVRNGHVIKDQVANSYATFKLDMTKYANL